MVISPGLMKYGLIALAALGVTSGIYYAGYTSAANKFEAEKVAAIQKATEEIMAQQEQINEAERQRYEEQVAITSRLTTELERMRQRATRMPEATRAECEGTTGAELSREDGSFLAREATRADRLRSALRACYQYADTVAH